MELHWELSVLSRAVAYNNLSGAAAHVGISQPQLSRIIQKIESELGVMVLDRGVKRKSTFTPLAHRLAETYTKSIRNMSGEIQQLIEGTEQKRVVIGTLEGLSDIATQLSRSILDKTGVRLLELDVYDLNQLEEVFFRGDLDFIFTSREPGRKKFRYSKVIGYQSLKKAGPQSGIHVMSSYEYGSLPTRKRSQESKEKVIISNSLSIRKNWIESFGGTGIIPSPLRRTSTSSSDFPVYLIGSETLSPSFWEKTEKLA